jgi:hypothetical protein
MQTQHQKMVLALTKAPGLILASLTESKCNLLHASNGLADEFFEYKLAVNKIDKENQLEELGDMLFYTEALIIGYEEHIPVLAKYTPMGVHETMQLLFQTVKRHVFYEQELNTKDLVDVYLNIKGWIDFFAGQIAKTRQDVQEHNMNKLAKRYEGFKYSDQAAKDRVDKSDEFANLMVEKGVEFEANPDLNKTYSVKLENLSNGETVQVIAD